MERGSGGNMKRRRKGMADRKGEGRKEKKATRSRIGKEKRHGENLSYE